jgi:hypothetical protein
MDKAHHTWLAAEYHVPSLYSCKVPMSSMNSALALPAPGPATVRLALIRAGIEMFGLECARDELFSQIRAMEIRIRPPELVAMTVQTLHAFKVDEQEIGTQISTAPISRECAHASSPLTVYIEVLSKDVSRWTEILRAIGYWGQGNSLVYCTNVCESVPDPKECVMPLRKWTGREPLEPFFSSFLTEFREGTLSWNDVSPMISARKAGMLKFDMYIWPMVTVRQHGGGKQLKRRAFAIADSV